MAKKFGGFTPEQQQTLLSKLGYDGPAQQDDINKYMMASPKAASMMGRYAEMARKRVEGDATVGFAAGGLHSLRLTLQHSLKLCVEAIVMKHSLSSKSITRCWLRLIISRLSRPKPLLLHCCYTCCYR
jgi:hypothetical protein